MATINTTLLSTVLTKTAPQLFADAVVKDSFFFNRIRKVPASNADGPTWNVKVTGSSSAAVFAEGGSYPAGSNFVDDQASLDWGRYVATVRFSGDMLDQARIGTGDILIANYINEQLADAMSNLVDTIDDDLVGGETTNGITGITAAVHDSNTYANIDRSSVTAWRARETTTASAITMAILDAMHLGLTITDRGNYTTIFSDQAVFDDYVGLTSGTGAPTVLNIDAGGTFSAGFVAGQYKGRPWVVVPNYTANRVDFIDERGLSLEVLRDITTSPLMPVQGTDDMVATITYKCQMRLDNPRKQAAYNDSLT